MTNIPLDLSSIRLNFSDHKYLMLERQTYLKQAWQDNWISHDNITFTFPVVIPEINAWTILSRKFELLVDKRSSELLTAGYNPKLITGFSQGDVKSENFINLERFPRALTAFDLIYWCKKTGNLLLHQVAKTTCRYNILHNKTKYLEE